jgi:hypothetical protein
MHLCSRDFRQKYHEFILMIRFVNVMIWLALTLDSANDGPDQTSQLACVTGSYSLTRLSKSELEHFLTQGQRDFEATLS